MSAKNRDVSQQLSKYVRPKSGRFMVNQKASVFADRRTRRSRSRSDNKRAAIDDSTKES